jgi:hypothetical protein
MHNQFCPIFLPRLEDPIVQEVILNKNRLKGMLKYKVRLSSCVSSQVGTQEDCQAGPEHGSIREQTMTFTIYSFKPQLENILPHILVLISYN